MRSHAIVARTLGIGLVVCVLGDVHPATGQQVDTTGTRLAGVRTGPNAVGFELRTGLDTSRPINQVDGGTKIGLALWYPARSSGAAGTAMTNLDYRLLEFVTKPSEAQRAAYLDNEVAALVSWRHVGVVAMSRAQARASLETHGLAVRGAPVADGRFPVVVVLGGQHYLSTTAEILASHGFLVVAPFRFSDQSNANS